MRQSIEINKKIYTPAKMTFNNVCAMEEMGAPIDSVDNHSMSTIRAYVGLCIGCDADTAGKEIEAHIIGGGNAGELFDCFREAVEESDFFQALNKTKDKETTAVEKPKKSSK